MSHIFYHGTSSNAEIGDVILPPESHGFGINEPGRTKNLDKVFFTTLPDYALTYARRACSRVGGEPVLYKVFASSPKKMCETPGIDIYYDGSAMVLEQVI
ncbi:hypothetical protein HWC21_gp092 [Vibrio phage VAP7]|uniref:Uncharacterized protein n=2 Tax=Vapseptimavirus VAP7 TaxID=2841303 RepID=A0A4Y5TV71_9CAUD|nr:hypothetical protein HWC21_gp092 [Vibrio phage VAP7]AWY10112.1 hypothetical protein [Vibrio phage VP-1]QDB73274.1 hypothetical protein [Vibrio phage VAP7]UFD98041.1 hypothetical protein [Vibrio phage BX-1]